jgi:hypothetical protein
LAGNSQLLPGKPSKRLFYDGSVKVRRAFNPLLLASTDLIIRSRRHYIWPDVANKSVIDHHHADRGWPDSAESTNIGVHSIEMRDLKEGRALPEFSKAANETVEDILTLMSFLSKSEIKCFGHAISDGRVMVSVYRRVAVLQDAPMVCENLLIDNEQDSVKFLRRAYKAYIGNAGDRALKQPLGLYVVAQRMPFVEEKLVSLFQVLEQVVGSKRYAPSIPKTLTTEQFRSVRKSIEGELRKLKLGKPQRDLILKKFGNVNQPDLRTKLNSILRRLKLKTRDVAAKPSIDTIFTARNRLIHGHGFSDYHGFIRATALLETLVEHMLMKLLRHTGHFRSPTYANEAWIKQPR